MAGYGRRFAKYCGRFEGATRKTQGGTASMWYDVEVGKPIRLRNQYGQELDRTIVSIDEKTVTYQCHEVEDGKLSTIDKKRFFEIYASMGIPYVEGQYGDRLAAELDPDFDWDWDEEGQLTLF